PVPSRGRDERCAPREIRPGPALDVDIRIPRPAPARSRVAPGPRRRTSCAGIGRFEPAPDRRRDAVGGPAPSRRRPAGGEACDGAFLSSAGRVKTLAFRGRLERSSPPDVSLSRAFGGTIPEPGHPGSPPTAGLLRRRRAVDDGLVGDRGRGGWG